MVWSNFCYFVWLIFYSSLLVFLVFSTYIKNKKIINNILSLNNVNIKCLFLIAVFIQSNYFIYLFYYMFLFIKFYAFYLLNYIPFIYFYFIEKWDCVAWLRFIFDAQLLQGNTCSIIFAGKIMIIFPVTRQPRPNKWRTLEHRQSTLRRSWQLPTCTALTWAEKEDLQCIRSFVAVCCSGWHRLEDKEIKEILLFNVCFLLEAK